MSTDPKTIWNGAYKIPWDEPGFSRRMLREHLSQTHDLASRRTEWIDRQVGWIHKRILGGKASRILDLGCGPGFYAHRLARLGHRLHGIDFGPASIQYAREHCPINTACEFLLGDLRHTDFAGQHDLAMLLYGELNVFSPVESSAILRKACGALVPGGQLIVEPQTPESIEATGVSEPTEAVCETGVFSDTAHRCRIEGEWLPDVQVAVQHFTVTELDSHRSRTYRSTNQSWPDDALKRLMDGAGLCDVRPCDDWPCNTNGLKLWVARKA